MRRQISVLARNNRRKGGWVHQTGVLRRHIRRKEGRKGGLGHQTGVLRRNNSRKGGWVRQS